MKAHLVPKRIIDRRGRSTTVWVRPGEVDSGKSSIAKIEADILRTTGNKVERGVGIDKNGNVVLDKVGSAKQIEFTDDEVKLLKGLKVFTHNHPSGSCFSPADLAVCLRNGIDTIRAIAPKSIKGDVSWVFERGTMDSDKDTSAFSNAYHLSHMSVRSEFEKSIWEKRMTIEEAESKHGYEVLKRVFEDSAVSVILKNRGAKFYWEKL